MYSTAHVLSEPDVLVFLAVIIFPCLFARQAGLCWVHTRLAKFHIAEYLNGIKCAALVRVNPEVSFKVKGGCEEENGSGKIKVGA